MTLDGNPYIFGSGPRKVLCLHGWFGHARGWGTLTDHLDAERHTYAFMDYRGYGQRLDEVGPCTLGQISLDARHLADQLGWATFALVGHSMGGSAIQQVLADAPDRVQCLVGITPVPASGVPFDEQGWALFSSARDDPQARRTILDMTTGGRRSAQWLDDMVASSQAHSRPDAVAGYLQSWAKTDFAARIQGMGLPVQVIVGRHDPALGEAFCRETWLKHYPQAQLQVLEEAGHYPMDEAPADLARIMQAFLEQHADAG